MDFDEVMQPFLKQVAENKKKSQRTLESYFTKYEDDRRFAQVNSKRLRTAIGGLTKDGKVPGLTVVGGGDEDLEKDDSVKEKTKKTKKTKKKKGTGEGGSVERKTKNARSAYNFFSMSERKKLTEEQPNLTFGEASKIISRKWKNIDSGTLEKFNKLSEEDKVRYLREKSIENEDK